MIYRHDEPLISSAFKGIFKLPDEPGDMAGWASAHNYSSLFEIDGVENGVESLIAPLLPVWHLSSELIYPDVFIDELPDFFSHGERFLCVS